MSEAGFEKELDPRISEAMAELAAQERRIAPPTHLRRRILHGFDQHFDRTPTHRRMPRQALWRPRSWQSNWSIQGWVVFASLAVLIVAGLVWRARLVGNDWLTRGDSPSIETSSRPPSASRAARMEDASRRQEPASPVPTSHSGVSPDAFWMESEAVLDDYILFEDLSAFADSEYLIYLEVPADHLAPQEMWEMVGVVEPGETRIARLALGDDGMVRAVHLPITPAPQ